MAYGDAKEHAGRSYRGMRVGGRHRWDYPDGIWTERKADPGRWEIAFVSTKRRKAKAPAKSGAQTGSGYHWLIVAHQWVRKEDANTYRTYMEGSKYLVAFRKPEWPVWNTQFRNQRRRAREKAIEALEDAIRRLKEGGDVEDAMDPVMREYLGFGSTEGRPEASPASTGVHQPGPSTRPSASLRRAAGSTRPKRKRSGNRPRAPLGKAGAMSVAEVKPRSAGASPGRP